MIRGFAVASWSERVRIVGVVALFGCAEVALRLVALPTLVKWLGAQLSTSQNAGRAGDWPQLSEAERRRLRVVRRVARHWIFGRGPCLRSALVEAAVLRRHRPVLCVGAMAADSGLQAHAWIEIDGVQLGAPHRFLPLHPLPR